MLREAMISHTSKKILTLLRELLVEAATEVFYEKAIFKNSTIFTEKHLCWSFLLIITLLKRDSYTNYNMIN